MVKKEGGISDETIKSYALENAIKYNGKASQGAVLAGLFAEGLKKSQIKDYAPRIQRAINEVNALTPQKQKELFTQLGDKTSKREVRDGLPELPNAQKGKVVMRFAPFPSGPLHIGNARTLILNDEYAKMYNGTLILAIDDTIGSVDKPIEPAAYKLIPESMNWLKVKYDKNIFYKSDRIAKYYEYAEEMLKKGYLYVCNCSKEIIHENRVKSAECSCRNQLPEENLKKWKEMFKAPEGSLTVRLKTDMKDADPAFRDRIMFRISDKPHAKIGKKYRVYPLLDFSWAIDDHILGVTHILRGTELTMETRVERFIWDIFQWPHPQVIYNGHFALEGIKISKSKGTKEVKSGKYFGWNDPLLWSLQSLRDRGIQPAAIRQFILGMGITKANITAPLNILYIINRKLLEDAPRYFFVEDPTKIVVQGSPEINARLPLHPHEKLGERKYKTNNEFLIERKDFDKIKTGEYRLMHLLTFQADKAERIRPARLSFDSIEPTNNKDINFLHWLPAKENNVKVEIRMPDNKIIKGLGEPELRNLLVGSVIQFERFGFVRFYKKGKGKLEFWFAHK